jgi:hypothetical protein
MARDHWGIFFKESDRTDTAKNAIASTICCCHGLGRYHGRAMSKKPFAIDVYALAQHDSQRKLPMPKRLTPCRPPKSKRRETVGSA